ncbi:hypothetical protein OK016_14450 [Vibrio chagasii]|nr:hypothetical protein [Vibrio chagasii]
MITTSQMRCVLPMLNEAVRCLDDGIIRSPRDGDIGVIASVSSIPGRSVPLHGSNGIKVTG